MRRRAIRAATLMALVILLLPVLAAAAPGQRPAGSGSRGAVTHGKHSGAVGGTTRGPWARRGSWGRGSWAPWGSWAGVQAREPRGPWAWSSRARLQVVLRRLRLGVRGRRPRDVAVVGILAGLRGPGVPHLSGVSRLSGLLSCCLSRVRISAAGAAPCARCSGRARRAWLDDADAGALVLAAGTSRPLGTAPPGSGAPSAASPPSAACETVTIAGHWQMRVFSDGQRSTVWVPTATRSLCR